MKKLHAEMGDRVDKLIRYEGYKERSRNIDEEFYNDLQIQRIQDKIKEKANALLLLVNRK